MYTIRNTVENKVIGSFQSEDEFTHFVKKIAIENDDEEMIITHITEATDYLETYCDNLELIR